jgi:iron complex outermembrane recepter protein
MKHLNLVPGVSGTALALALVATQAHAQEALPTIDVGAASQPVSGGGQATGTGTGNGTSIGAGSNGQICADGLCNDPTSYSAPVQSLGTKVNTPAIETPLATKVITHQMLEDQQVTSLDQALRNVSGVYVAGGGSVGIGVPYLGVVIRGFTDSAYYRDGVRVDNFQASGLGVAGAEFANLDSVEVLKGPAAILYGAVEPGGIVNLNTKQPLDKPAYSIQQQFGSYQAYRTSFDATGPLSQNKDVLYRFTGSYENDGSFQTFGYNRNYMFNPVVKWNIDANTWIKVEDQYQQNRTDQIFTWIPYFNNVVPLWLGRSMNWGPPSPYSQDQNFVQVKWRHDFNNDWSVEQTAFWQALTSNSPNDSPTMLSDCITPGGACYLGANAVQVGGYPYINNTRQAEYATVLDITGHFKTGDIDHKVLLGADYYRYNNRGIIQAGSYFAGPYAQPWTLTLFGNPALPPAPTFGLTPTFASEQYADNVGAYVQDQIKLPYGFNVLAGARYQYINNRISSSDGANFCGQFSANWANGLAIPCNFDTQTMREQSIDQRATPRVAALWRPLEWFSLYGNYVESYSPNYNGLLVLGTNIPNPPSAGQQEEAGVKFALLDNKLQIAADYYHLVKTNIPVGLQNYPGYEILVGEGRSQGPELDIQGELSPGWTVNFAYANTDAKVTKATPFNSSFYNPPIGSPFPYVPRNQGSLASNYEFKDGPLKGLKLGARYDYAGYLPFFNYASDGSYIYGLNTPSYGIVGLLASYEFMYNGFKVRAQINVDNLFDKTYFTFGGFTSNPFGVDYPPTPGWSNNYGQNTVIGVPRTIRGLIGLAF